MIPHWTDETHRMYTSGMYTVNEPLTLDESIKVHDFDGVTVYLGERFPRSASLFTNGDNKIINHLKIVPYPYAQVVN